MRPLLLRPVALSPACRTTLDLISNGYARASLSASETVLNDNRHCYCFFDNGYADNPSAEGFMRGSCDTRGESLDGAEGEFEPTLVQVFLCWA